MADKELSMKYNKIYEDMLKGLKEYIEKKIDESNFDKTYLGTIMGEGSTKGLKVLINDVVYDNVDSATFLYNPNSIVRVLVPQNDFKRAYVIGTTKMNPDQINNIYKDLYEGFGIDNIFYNGLFNMVIALNNYMNYLDGTKFPAIDARLTNLGQYILVGNIDWLMPANSTAEVEISVSSYNLTQPPYVFTQLKADKSTYNATNFGLAVRSPITVDNQTGIVENIYVVIRSNFNSEYRVYFWMMLYRH